MFHTPAHKQPAQLTAFRDFVQHPDMKAVEWSMIDRIMAATSSSEFVARSYLQAAMWDVEEAIKSLLADRNRPVIADIVDESEDLFKIPPTGRRVRLGDILKSRHLYSLGVGGGWSIEVDANSRDQARRIAEREGYTVRDVNMVG